MKAVSCAIALVLFVVFVLIPVRGVMASIWPDDYDWPRDLGGRRIGVNTRWREVTPLGLRYDYNWYAPDTRLQAWIETVEEWFNVDIEFVEPGDRHAQLVEMVMTGDALFDYVNITRHELPLLVAEGFIHALDTIYVEDYLSAIPDRFRFFVRPPLSAERMFGIPWMFEPMGYSKELTGLWWNKELFEAAGKPTPYDLWDEDEWTLEALETLASEFTRDTTGDGNTNQWGLSNLGGRWWNNLLVFNEAALTKSDEDGYMRVSITEPQAVWVWEWMVHMRNEEEVVGGHIIDGSAAMRIDWFHAIRYPSWQASEHTFGFLPWPQGPDAPWYRVPTGNIWMGVVPILSQDPRAIVEVVSALYMFKYPYIEPGEPLDRQLAIWEERFWDRWAMSVHDQRSMDFKEWMTPRVVHSDHKWEAADIGFWEAIDEIDLHRRSVSAVMGEFEVPFQAIIDEMYEQ